MLISNKDNNVTQRNSINNNGSDKNSGGDSSDDSDSVNEGLNKGYSAKITHTQDESGMLVNHGIITPYTSSLKPSDQLVSTSLHVKKSALGFGPDTTIYIEYVQID